MTAKLKHGHGAHRATHGADPGTPHERLNRDHARPGRPEGAPMSAQASRQSEAGDLGESPPQAPASEAMGEMPNAQAPAMEQGQPGEGPSTDDEEDEQT